MKILAVLCLFSFGLQAQEETPVVAPLIGGDGCYQLYQPGALFPTLCLSGTEEEGINGSGVRVVLVGPNSTKVSWCGKSLSAARESNKLKLTFEATGPMRSIQFEGKVEDSGREGGQVTLVESSDSNTLKYLKLEPKVVLETGKKAFSSKVCKDAGVDE